MSGFLKKDTIAFIPNMLLQVKKDFKHSRQKSIGRKKNSKPAARIIPIHLMNIGTNV
jgi:hypothetical protein